MKRTTYQSDIGESYVKAELSSGLEIYILEKPLYNSCYALFGTKYGSIDNCFEVNGEKTQVPHGIAHFLEHKLFESEDGDAFSKYAQTGAYANAFTSFDRTCYLFSCSDKFYENLDILLSFVQSPYFTEQTVQKEQGIIGQEIRMYDDSPAWRVMFNMLMAMYQNHPVKIDIAGTAESISQITAEALYKCYNTFYNPANMFICIAGNVDTEKVLAKIKSSIKMTEKIEAERIFEAEGEEIVKPYVEQSLAVSQPMFCLGFKEALKNPQCSLKERVATSMLLELIAGDSSPLYKRLITNGLINDEFSSEHFCGNGYSAIIFEGESQNPKAVAREIAEEIERLKADGIDKKLFAAVRRGMYGNAIRTFNSVEGIAMQLTDCAVSGSNLFDEIKYLRSLTLDDVYKRLAVLNNDRSVLSVIMPKEEA